MSTREHWLGFENGRGHSDSVLLKSYVNKVYLFDPSGCTPSPHKLDTAEHVDLFFRHFPVINNWHGYIKAKP